MVERSVITAGLLSCSKYTVTAIILKQSTPLYSDTLVQPDFVRIKQRNGVVRIIRIYTKLLAVFVLFFAFCQK